MSQPTSTTRINRPRIRRGRSAPFRGFTRLGAALVVVTGSVACSQHRLPDGPPLQIHNQATGSKYTYKSPAEQPVWDWFELDPSFVSTLERHPTALEEARKARTAHTANQIFGAAYLAWGIKLAFFSWETDRLGLNHYTASGGDWALLGGLFVGMIASGRAARGHLDRAVSRFNAEETGANPGEDARQSVFTGLRLSPMFGPRAGVGVAARLFFP